MSRVETTVDPSGSAIIALPACSAGSLDRALLHHGHRAVALVEFDTGKLAYQARPIRSLAALHAAPLLLFLEVSCTSC